MEAIKILKNLWLETSRRRAPHFPENARIGAVPRYSDKTANGLTKMIIDFLKFNGWQAERVSVTGRYIDKSKVFTDCIGRQRRIGSGKWIPASMQPGTADISATIAGRSVKIEVKCKATKDWIRPEQREYQKQVEAAGGIYVVTTDFESFYKWYNLVFTPELCRANHTKKK